MTINEYEAMVEEVIEGHAKLIYDNIKALKSIGLPAKDIVDAIRLRAAVDNVELDEEIIQIF